MNSRRMDADVIRALLLLSGAVGQFAAGFAPGLLGWEHTISTRSSETRTLLIPGGGAFVIWLPLFFGNIAFAVFAALPSRLRQESLAAIGWYSAAAFWVNTFRSLYEPLNGPGWTSLAMLFGILIPLLFAADQVRRRGPWTGPERWALAPVLGQAGWISIACAAGVTQTMAFTASNPAGISAAQIALSVLVVWAIVAAPLIWRIRSFVYAGAAAWGLFWVFASTFLQDEQTLAVAAATAAIGVLLLTWLAKRWRSTS